MKDDKNNQDREQSTKIFLFKKMITNKNRKTDKKKEGQENKLIILMMRL